MDESFDYISKIIPATETMFLVPSSSSAPPAGSTWNPSDADIHTVLSNGNLTAAQSGAADWSGVRGTLGKASGAWYFEAKRTVKDLEGNIFSGVADLTTTPLVDGDRPGAPTPNGCGCRRDFNDKGGEFVQDNVATFGGSDALNDVYMFALDIDNKKIWRGLNGTWLGSVTPTVGGAGQWCHWVSALTIYPMTACGAGSTDASTLQAASGSLSFSPPAGFTAWG